MVKCNICFWILLFSFLASSAQKTFYYTIQFTDKNNSQHSLDRPEEFLSDRSIERRVKQGITISDSDLPIPKYYMDSILSIGNQKLVTKSKWFNSLVVSIQDTSVLSKSRKISFIRSITRIPGSTDKSNGSKVDKLEVLDEKNTYGQASNQIDMLNGLYLHSKGFRGEGMLIGVIDAGFTNAKELEVFNELWNDNRIVGYYDFVDNDENVFEKSNHGTYVLSTMAANLPGVMVGTAPKASYLLLRSEDGASEQIIEEDFWIAAAEYADSAGADILNTSLGYTTFDDEEQNHSYEDLDGNTTRITLGADMAASKGMLVINSAGNSGNSGWFYIGAPADGDSVLAIGAVNQNREYATFSSKGPAFDKRIKPNVVAQGNNTVLSSFDGGTFSGNGTSFSSPIIAGMAACLWQSQPSKNNMEIFRAIEKSASHYLNPDDFVGNGIPNFGLAFLELSNSSGANSINSVLTIPNPFINELRLLVSTVQTETISIIVYNPLGKILYEEKMLIRSGQKTLTELEVMKNVDAGLYYVHIKGESINITRKVIKQ